MKNENSRLDIELNDLAKSNKGGLFLNHKLFFHFRNQFERRIQINQGSL